MTHFRGQVIVEPPEASLPKRGLFLIFILPFFLKNCNKNLITQGGDNMTKIEQQKAAKAFSENGTASATRNSIPRLFGSNS